MSPRLRERRQAWLCASSARLGVSLRLKEYQLQIQHAGTDEIDGTGTTSFTRVLAGLLVGERLLGGSRFYYLYDGTRQRCGADRQHRSGGQ
jgi:hypothetical protein